jgi:hypothetical protein
VTSEDSEALNANDGATVPVSASDGPSDAVIAFRCRG